MNNHLLKYGFTIGFVFLLNLVAIADETPEIEWKMDDLNPGRSQAVVLDETGNSYFTGTTEGSLEGTNLGGNDVFVVKCSPKGEKLWVKQFGSTEDDEAWYVALDGAGNCFVCGGTSGEINGENVGRKDAYLAKFTVEGEHLWSRQLGTSTNDVAKRIVIGKNGECHVLGTTTGDFGITEKERYNAFVACYDTDGNQQWIRQPHAEDREYKSVNDLNMDTAGNIYLTGGPGYLAKCEPSGLMLWEVRFESRFTTPWGIEVSPSGIINVTGWTSSYVAFINRYKNEDGERLWSRTFIKNGWSCPKKVVTFPGGDDLLIGGCQGGFSGGHCDGFMYKYNSTGENLWITERNKNYCGESVAVDKSGNSYLVGGIDGSAFLIKFKAIAPTSVKPKCSCVKKNSMLQNYPNPFNPKTKITFNLATTDYATLKIYNISGQHVATLVDGIRNSGEQQAEWRANGFPSGIYFYKLTTSHFSETKKLVLQR